MSSPSEDEPMEYTAHSSVAHTSGTGLDTIIQSLNKRYEVYQKRRAAVTPFDTPMEPTLIPQPAPRSILGDSTIARPSSAASALSKQHSTSGITAAAQTLQDPFADSIRVANTHPAPYWEERELYITAESLCCYLNGGVNYRLVCEQYQRALELMLSLVKEDVKLCARGEVEVLPGGTTRALGKLQELLKESRTMLEEAGVDVPPKLSSMIDQIPAAPAELPFSESAPAYRNQQQQQPQPPSSSANGAGGTRSPHARPPSALLTPSRRQPSANGVNASNDNSTVHNNNQNNNTSSNSNSDGVANGAPHAPPSTGNSRRPPQSRNRSSISSPDTAHLPVHFHFTGNNPSTSSSAAAAAGVGGNGAGGRRSTPSSAIIVDPPVLESGSQGVLSEENANGAADAGAARDAHGGILRPSMMGTTGSVSQPSSTAPTPLANASTATRAKDTAAAPYVAHPPHEESPYATRPTPLDKKSAEERQKGAAAAATSREDSVMDTVSPIPSTPPPPLYEDLVGGLRQQQQQQQQQQGGGDGEAEELPPQPARTRLRALQELYGELYALDGMTLLTDALGVVFTHEYDQGTEQQYQNGFASFQRDVNAKVTPALKSYEALQLRINELTPLRSAYLASCLMRRVRPHEAVLEQLKRIDHDRTAETLLLGGLHLGDLGTAAVVESIVPRLYRLRTLNLSDNNLHDSALEHVLRAVRYHPALEVVDLSRNPVTDSAVPYLLRMAQTVPKLRSLLLQSSGMSAMSKQMIETEVTQPGTYVLPASASASVRRPLSSLSPSTAKVPSVVAGVLPVVTAPSASAPRSAPHPPTAHRPPSSVDGRNRWSPKTATAAAAAAAARAESMPTRVSSAARRPMTKSANVSNGNSGSAGEAKLPPLPHTASGPGGKRN